ncbi:transcriptional regulator [Vibrio cholerae]|nr:transcriptional regulator [Vibrio cholerae]EGR0031508.1 transcriptional regulator [Vibrio cholerae]EGR0608973.1 transcriptional regulator [Vibrio cholerae]EGR1279023.1 transcriptional regulator [Vibrio cholerae]EGR5567027.1 transcriptional regulator [Vibrio cholerae]
MTQLKFALSRYCTSIQNWINRNAPNKRLKRDCQRAAFPVPLSRGGCSCCV